MLTSFKKGHMTHQGLTQEPEEKLWDDGGWC